MRIEYHADDYGLFPEQSKRILDTFTHGALNGISIMPNSPYLDECMEWIKPFRDRISITVHLNFVEGRALTPKEEIPDLVDEMGNFNISFGRMLLASYNPFVRKRYFEEITKEVRAQIRKCLPYFENGPEGGIRLDGHVHYQMIPLLFDAIARVIREDSLHVVFIRIPRENMALYRRHEAEIDPLEKINKVKVLVLNALARRNRRKYPALFAQIEPYDFMGVAMSGHMSEHNVAPLLQDAVKTAEKEGRNLEVLFHPGAVFEPEDAAELTSVDDLHFLTSQWRTREAETLRAFGSR